MQGDAMRHTILLVDDHSELLEFMTDALRELGDFDIVTALNGEQGLERYYEVRPDCMVIDIRMPGLDGYQLVRALRGDPETAQTPLVILTAMAQDVNRVASLAAGADQYLIKPVDPVDLVAAVHRAIQQSGEERLRALRTLLDELPQEE
jgi:CheY-like chemotaxis protein